MLSDTDVDEHYFNSTVRSISIERNNLQTNWGFHLTRSKFDPYPWICTIDDGTPAKLAGLKIGDCLLEVNGDDIVGLRITEIAELVKKTQISLLLWNSGTDTQCNPESICCGPMPMNFQRLSACMSTILTYLECPICLDTIPPPTYQCDNGHLICIRCRTKSEKCPVCRLRFTRGRSLLSDQIYNTLIDTFELKNETNDIRNRRMQQIFKLKTNKNDQNQNIPEIKITQSHTNKFLAKLTGKSTSADNLDNTKLVNQNEFNGQLKIKSLSTNEIFQDESPSVSRSSSTTKLSRNDKNKYLTLNSNRSASCHGSFESLQRKTDFSLFNKIDNDEILYYCPFSQDCSTRIESNNVIEHFQTNHDGFLVQIFKPQIRIKLKKIFKHRRLCYVIQFDGNIFFLKVELDENKLENVLLWTWFLGCRQLSKDYDMHVKLYDNDETVFSARNCVYSLDTFGYSHIKQTKKFVFLNIKTFTQTIENIALDIDISRSDNQ